jgi:DNA invertase Pin-like site-specific DNA recombinase
MLATIAHHGIERDVRGTWEKAFQTTAETALWRAKAPKIKGRGRDLVNYLSLGHAYGVSFVSLRDNLDLSTPSGRLMFQVVGAMAEFERALTQERVKAGLRLAKSKGKRLGRPRTAVDAKQVAALRASGASWKVISRELVLEPPTGTPDPFQKPPRMPIASA